MFNQPGFAHETLPAFRAGEGPLPRVDSEMEDKTGLVQKALSTEGT